jgi:propanol-preferring alcohol dehydrogenase
VDGELPDPVVPIIPGHEIVGRIDAVGPGVAGGVGGLAIGERVGIPWLGHTCGVCHYCQMQRENLCDHPIFTGYTRDGGFATAAVADARFAFPLGEVGSDVSLAPLLCAGLIGWRALAIAGESQKLGLYGFGAAAHILAQVAKWQGRSVFAFTRPGDITTQAFARGVGAVWAGGSDELPPEPLDAAIIFATAGELVPRALRAVRKGGRVVCAGIHMNDIPSFPYTLLWEERQILSVANLTRQDGIDFLSQVPAMGIVTHTTQYPLEQANQALTDLRAGRFDGAAVLVP